MRLFSMLAAVSAMMWIYPGDAGAQGKPLYNGSATTGTTSLYNSNQNGTGAGKPLSLNQIMSGTNATGYEYQRGGTGYTPYGTQNLYNSNSLSPSVEEVNAYRAQQADAARRAELEAQRSLLSYANPDADPNAQTQTYLNQFQGQPQTGASPAPYAYKPPTQVYKGRDLGIDVPKRVFNSVQ